MRENWDRSVQNVLLWEGGWAERSNEPGGAVNKGVSLQAFREWRRGKGLPEPTKADLKALSDDEAKQIYAEKYAKPIGFDDMPAGYDYALLTASVMFGPGRGTRERPGAPGFHDLAQGDLGLLVVLMMRVKMHDPNCVKFGPGWSDRFLAVYRLARELMREGKP
jgi:Glycosyl hydrolase 108